MALVLTSSQVSAKCPRGSIKTITNISHSQHHVLCNDGCIEDPTCARTFCDTIDAGTTGEYCINKYAEINTIA